MTGDRDAVRDIVDVVIRRAADRPNQVVAIANERGRWIPLTAGALADRVQALAVGLSRQGIVPGDRVGLIVGNSLEFIVADLAVQAIGAVSAAVPPSDDDEGLAGELQQLGPRLLVVKDSIEVERIRGLVAAGRLDAIEILAHAGAGDGTAPGLDDLEAAGRAALAEQPDGFDDVRRATDPASGATVTYTAGAGGRPRAVVHASAAVLGAARAAAEVLALVPDDVTVVGLDPSHPHERAVNLYPALVSGAVLAYPEDDSTYDQAVAEVRPSFGHVHVDRLRGLTSEIHARLRRNKGIKRLVARWWDRAALRSVRAGGAPSRLAHLVVGRPALRSAGWNEMRVALVTGDAVPADVLATLTALGLPVRSGYATVEAGLIAIGGAVDGRALTALPGITVTATDGQIVVRTPNLATGAVDGSAPASVDGGFATGDAGAVDGTGRVRVEGPIASSVRLPDGSEVNTAAVERALRDSPYIALASVNISNGVLNADIAIDRNGVSSWAAERRLPFTTLSSLVGLDEVRQLIADEVARLAPDVVHHDLLNRPLQQGREITRTGKTIHGGLKTTDAGPAPVPRNETASAIE